MTRLLGFFLLTACGPGGEQPAPMEQEGSQGEIASFTQEVWEPEVLVTKDDNNAPSEDTGVRKNPEANDDSDIAHDDTDIKQPDSTQESYAPNPGTLPILQVAPISKNARQLPTPLEKTASAIATGRVGRSFTHNGKKHIEIEIAEVIVGEAQNSGGTPADGPPVFVFSPGTTFATPSTEFKRGARVAIYFKGNPDRGWSLLTVQALTQSTERFRAKVRAARTETSESPSKRRRK